jgi:hypothetical protein
MSASVDDMIAKPPRLEAHTAALARVQALEEAREMCLSISREHRTAAARESRAQAMHRELAASDAALACAAAVARLAEPLVVAEAVGKILARNA